MTKTINAINANVLSTHHASSSRSSKTESACPKTRAGFLCQREDHRACRVQSLAGATGGSGDSPLHRHGLWVQCVLVAPFAGHRRQRSGGSACERLLDRTDFFHAMGLESQHAGMGLYPLLCFARLFDRHLGKVDRTRWATQSRIGLGVLLVRRPRNRRARSVPSPDFAPLAGSRCDWRDRSRTRLYLTRHDLDPMVSGSSWHGHGHGDHGLWRRSDDRRATRR